MELDAHIMDDPSRPKRRLLGIAITLALLMGGIAVVLIWTRELRPIRTIPNPEHIPWCDEFGASVAVSDNFVLVGNPSNQDPRQKGGAAYLFHLKDGKVAHAFHSPTPAEHEHFGWAVALSGNQVLIGSHWEPHLEDRSKRVYQFDAISGELIRVYDPAIHDQRAVNNSPSGASAEPTRIGALFEANDFEGYALSGVSGKLMALRSGIRRSTRISIFDIESGDLLRVIPNPNPDGPSGFFGPTATLSGNLLAVRAGDVYLFDVKTGALLRTFKPPATGPYRSVRFENICMSEGRLAAATFRYLMVFDVMDGALIQTFERPPGIDSFESKQIWLCGDHVLALGEPDRDGYLFDINTGACRKIVTSLEGKIKFRHKYAIGGHHLAIGTHEVYFVGSNDRNLGPGRVRLYELPKVD